MANTWPLAQPEQILSLKEWRDLSDTFTTNCAGSAAYCSAAPCRPLPEIGTRSARRSVRRTCQGVPHVEGIPEQQRSGRVNGRGWHELVLHAADAARPHRLQKRLPQLLRNLRSSALALSRHALRPSYAKATYVNLHGTAGSALAADILL